MTEEQIPQEIVDEAVRTGWQPLEEFKGDESKWRPADQWVERGREYLPIIKSQLKGTEQELAQYKSKFTQIESELERQRETTKKIVEMSKTVGEQAYERARKDIQSKQAKAVADGDVQTWQQLEDQKDQLQKPEPIQMEEAPVQTNPVFDQWKGQNDWYGKDPDVSIYADGYGDTLKQQNPNMAYEDILKAVETKVREVFPNKFTNPNRETATTVEETNQRTQTTQTGKKSYNNLPADAKVQCDAFVEQGLLTRDKFVEDYYGLEADMEAKRQAILGRA